MGNITSYLYLCHLPVIEFFFVHAIASFSLKLNDDYRKKCLLLVKYEIN